MNRDNSDTFQRIGIRLGISAGAIVAALVSGPAAHADDSVEIDPNGAPIDVQTSGIPGLFTDTSETQDWATFASHDNGPFALLTPADLSEFPSLTSADIGSADVSLNVFDAGGWGVAFTDVASATGALSGNVGDLGLEFLTPFGDLPIDPAFGFIPHYWISPFDRRGSEGSRRAELAGSIGSHRGAPGDRSGGLQ